MLTAPKITLKNHDADSTILVIEDNYDDFYLVKQMLAKDLRKTYLLLHAETLEEAFITIAHESVNLILLDLGLAQTQGLETLTHFRHQIADIPVIVFTGVHDEDIGEKAIKLGAEDYIPKSQANSAILSRAISYAIERHTLLTKIQQQVWLDALTGLPNRSALFQYLTTQINNAQRKRLSINVVMLDLDGFKEINDDFGHQAGDDVLIAVANRLNQNKRASDFIARLGGDEFIWVLVECHPDEKVLELLEEKLSLINEPIVISVNNTPHNVHVGASIGVTTWHGEQNPQMLISTADKAMYISKNKGKNKISLI